MATIIRGKNARKPYTVRYQHEGRQRERSFRTSAEAKDFKAKFEHESRAQIYTDPAVANVRFEEAAAGWLSRHLGAPRTLENYESNLRLHINPALGSKPLSTVATSPEVIEIFLRETLPRKELGASVVRSCYTIINAVVNDAIRSGRLSQSRIRGIRLPVSPVKAEIPFATHAQIATLAAKCPEPYGWTVYLMRGCGLRLGEALGVSLNDLAGNRLRLSRQLSPDGIKHIGLKHRDEGEYRDIPAPAYVVERAPLTAPYDAPVAHRKYRDWFNSARDSAGLPPTFTPHTLRHIFASNCLAAGVPITDVSKWLGHKNIQVTFGIYGHLVPASFDRARQVLDEEWARPT
jgi:integrase